MNKRIDQLLVKAGAYFGGKGVVYDNFDPKKFANLIIQEAGEAFWSEACHVSDLAYEEYSRNSKKIKRHFEVNPKEITTAMLDTAINQIEEYKKYVAQQQKENLPHISYVSWELYNKPKKEQE
jgi:hypothetical protein